MLRTLLRFSRPHTIIATSVQVFTLFLIVVGSLQALPAALGPVGLALITCLALNLYVVGLNQLTDVSIDRINKPHLPLAAGDFSPQEGRRITFAAGALGLVLALIAGPYLFVTVALIMAIGTIYSVPPLRLKRFPIPAALSIALARGLIANLGLALHYNQVFGGQIPVVTLSLLGLFFFGFALVIAIYKDLPDREGDQLHQIETFTTRLGPRQVLNSGRVILTVCYAIPMLLALLWLPGAAPFFLLLSHAVLSAIFWWGSIRVDLSDNQNITRFYMLIWALFYAEFVVLSIYELIRVSL
ncbi:homogentisate phytyltransferase [Candidatus Chloroploca sp. M-50]|uniref:Homogentisate phytyltransferase n=1 Tax=Candidatus Chloroploca mongolica TaxID=2528176 RepID=A0ABS4D6P0_9CHLR|nr:homogentisate phytyltransferase [Candidatus Chloroploca mongolica]MBP1465080.1 homogentisate phytyltransferase [Candidatus Chloroploca mongolica]